MVDDLAMPSMYRRVPSVTTAGTGTGPMSSEPTFYDGWFTETELPRGQMLLIGRAHDGHLLGMVIQPEKDHWDCMAVKEAQRILRLEVMPRRAVIVDPPPIDPANPPRLRPDDYGEQ